MAVATSISRDSTRNPLSERSSLGVNCRGNFWCPWIPQASNHILQYLIDWINAEVDDEDLYSHREHIACATLYADRKGRGSAFCLYTNGRNLAPPGIKGSEIKRKALELRKHGCFACGTVPLGDNNDPDDSGVLTLNYVLETECSTLSREESPVCPPYTAASTPGADPKPSGGFPTYKTFNLTLTNPAYRLPG